jgi:hypothetical protein
MRLTRSTAMAAAILIGASGAALAQNQTSGSGAGGSATSGATGTQAGQQPLTNQQGVSSQGGVQQGTVQDTRGLSPLEAQARQRRLQQQGNQPVGQQGQGTVGSGTAGQQGIGGARSQGGPALRTTPQLRDFDRPDSGPGAQLGTGANNFDQLQFDFNNLTPQEQELLLQGRLGGTAGSGSGRIHMPQDRLNRLQREQLGDLTDEEILQLQREGRLLGNNEFLGSRVELASTLRRLESLEERMLRRKDMLLQRLGQVRQLPPERQVAAHGEILQQMLLDHEQMITYMSELRMVVQNQGDFGTGTLGDRRVDRDLRGTSGLNRGSTLGNRNVGTTGVRQSIQPQRFQWEIESDSRTSGQASPNQRVLGTDDVNDTWQDWQDFRREERPR